MTECRAVLSAVAPSVVRDVIAHALIAGDADAPTAIGAITLRQAQRDTVHRCREALSAFGGVLVAEDVGSGKTYVALALAEGARRPLVIAPAVLARMWADASAHANTPLTFVSVESLSRGHRPHDHDFVIVDEAHHLRNPATRRYAAALDITRTARVVLLSATPVHNTARDADALLALFLGAGAGDLSDADRARVIVREAGASTGPSVRVHDPIPVPDVPRIMRLVARLPSPPSTRDGNAAPALLRLALLRAWCSSVGAFSSMTRRASLRAAALGDALRAGRHPTRSELSAWTLDDGQLAFAELVATDTPVDAVDVRAADELRGALDALRAIAGDHAALDDARAHALQTIARAHAGTPILACTQYAETALALWRRMRTHAGTALLTSRGAEIASGPIAREQALALFAPSAQGARTPHERERIRLLIATDLVSEGLNLQDAGVVVHLDLPWTAARLAQRVGRVARHGSPHAEVHVHSLAPPRATAAMLSLERRVRRKRRIAVTAIGGSTRAAQLLGGADSAQESVAEAHARVLRLLAPHARNATVRTTGIPSTTVRASHMGWLALVDAGTGPRLLVRRGRGTPTTDPGQVARYIECLVRAPDGSIANTPGWALREVVRWLARDRGRTLAGSQRTHAARAHRQSIARVVGTVGGAAPHERARAAAHASGALAVHRQARTTPGVSIMALAVFCTDADDTPGGAVRS